MDEKVKSMVCVLSYPRLLSLLERARDGADPEMLIMEFYANSVVEKIGGNDE